MLASKKAGSHKKNIFGVKNIEIIRIIAENKSTALRTSPLNRNKLFIPRSPAQNNIRVSAGVIPNIKSKKHKQDTASINPKIFSSIKLHKNKIIYN